MIRQFKCSPLILLTLQSDLEYDLSAKDEEDGITFDDWIKYCSALDKRWAKDVTTPTRMWNAMVIQQGFMPDFSQEDESSERDRTSSAAVPAA